MSEPRLTAKFSPISKESSRKVHDPLLFTKETAPAWTFGPRREDGQLVPVSTWLHSMGSKKLPSSVNASHCLQTAEADRLHLTRHQVPIKARLDDSQEIARPQEFQSTSQFLQTIVRTVDPAAEYTPERMDSRGSASRETLRKRGTFARHKPLNLSATNNQPSHKSQGRMHARPSLLKIKDSVAAQLEKEAAEVLKSLQSSKKHSEIAESGSQSSLHTFTLLESEIYSSQNEEAHHYKGFTLTPEADLSHEDSLYVQESGKISHHEELCQQTPGETTNKHTLSEKNSKATLSEATGRETLSEEHSKECAQEALGKEIGNERASEQFVHDWFTREIYQETLNEHLSQETPNQSTTQEFFGREVGTTSRRLGQESHTRNNLQEKTSQKAVHGSISRGIALETQELGHQASSGYLDQEATSQDFVQQIFSREISQETPNQETIHREFTGVRPPRVKRKPYEGIKQLKTYWPGPGHYSPMLPTSKSGCSFNKSSRFQGSYHNASCSPGPSMYTPRPS